MEDIETDTGDGYSPPSKNIGLILDVKGEILSKLLRFDKQDSFVLNGFKDSKEKVITLINGTKDMPFYRLNNLLQSSFDFLNNYSKSFGSTFNKFRNFLPLTGKKSISDVIDEENIFKTIKKNNTSFEPINSEKINKTILDIKNILSNSFGSFNQEKFISFNNHISKQSFINLTLNKIFDAFNYTKKKS